MYGAFTAERPTLLKLRIIITFIYLAFKEQLANVIVAQQCDSCRVAGRPKVTPWLCCGLGG